MVKYNHWRDPWILISTNIDSQNINFRCPFSSHWPLIFGLYLISKILINYKSSMQIISKDPRPAFPVIIFRHLKLSPLVA